MCENYWTSSQNWTRRMRVKCRNAKVNEQLMWIWMSWMNTFEQLGSCWRVVHVLERNMKREKRMERTTSVIESLKKNSLPEKKTFLKLKKFKNSTNRKFKSESQAISCKQAKTMRLPLLHSWHAEYAAYTRCKGERWEKCSILFSGGRFVWCSTTGAIKRQENQQQQQQ